MVDENKPTPDWKRIEALFRAGLLSLRQICAEVDHSVTEGAIRRRAKVHGWTRDLRARIASEVERRLQVSASGPSLRTPSTQLTQEDEDCVVEGNVQLGVAMRIRQREDARRLRALASRMLAELELETAHYPEFEELGEMLRAPDDKGQDKRNDIYSRAISLGGRVENAKKLCEILEKLQKIENEAYGLNEREGAASPLDEMLKKLHAERLGYRARTQLTP